MTKRLCLLFGKLLVITGLYFCAGRLGLSLAFLNSSASAVWAPTGLALAAVLLLGYEIWPAILVGAFLVNFATTHLIASSACIGVGNMLEAVVGAALTRRFAAGTAAFAEVENIVRYTFFAAIPSTMISALCGLATLLGAGLLSRHDCAAVWFTWWLGDFVSDLIVAPLIVIWVSRPLPRFSYTGYVEAVGLLILLLCVSQLVFGGWTSLGTEHYPTAYLMLPLLVWAAIRFKQHGAILAAGVVSATALYGTLKGLGPFIHGPPNTQLLMLQAYIGVTTLTILVLASLLSERDALLGRERLARTEAERANQSKDQFLAVLSHELRTPLTPVILMTSLLENAKEIPEAMRSELRNIHRNVKLEARLIDDLLDLTRIARGKLQLELQPVDIHRLILSAIEISSANGEPKLEVDLDASMHYVQADSARIQQVFWNLLNNAQKFTPGDGTIRIRSRNADDHFVLVEVSDTGVGIAPDLLPRLFTAFEQGDPKRIGRAGLGLGLTIAKTLMEAHGGTIAAFSEGTGRGSTFTVRMPTIPHVPEKHEIGEIDLKEPAEGLRPLRILLVEDDEYTLMAMEKLLSRRQHYVRTANSVASAIDAARQERFDLLISDVGLPDGLPYDMMRMISKDYGAAGIALSGYGMDEDIRRSIDAGFCAHLTKPVDIANLEAAIARAVGRNRSAGDK